MKFEKVNPATGAAEPGFSRNNSGKIQVNHHTGHLNDGRLVNKGRGPTVGNKSDLDIGPKSPPTTKSLPNTKSASTSAYAGTFNAGAQVRTPGGTRPFDPSATENYRGDYNRINLGRGPTKGNSQ